MLTNSFSQDSIKDLLQRPNTLMVLPLSGRCQYSQAGVIDTGLSGFDSSESNEVWQVSGQSIDRGVIADGHWAKTNSILCVSRWVALDTDSNIEDAIESAYNDILTVIKDEGYPFTARFWNYLPNINVGHGDEEVYKRFCTGRLKAFNSFGVSPEDYPAASALGHYGTGAVVFVLASKNKPQHFVNRKQVNAYEYPRQYGVSSPSFARASALSLDENKPPCLFISGTASILGHETVHSTDLMGQLETTASNIEQLMIQTDTSIDRLRTIKVYVRHTEHAKETQTWLQERYPKTAILLTHADICRESLLVEIECFCH